MENKDRKAKKDLKKVRTQDFFFKLKNAWPLSKVSGRIFLIYLLIVLVGGLFLSIPGFVKSDKFQWDFITAVFTAVSAFSDTGITISNAAQDYTLLGQIVLLILIEIGGIGVLTIKIVIFIIINKKISLDDTIIAQSERGGSVKSSTIEMIKDGFVFISFVQIISAAILFFLFFYLKPSEFSDNMALIDGEYKTVDLSVVSPYKNFSQSFWFSIFHSTSAINNAGFDIVSGNSLQPYNVNNAHHYSIQIVFLMEWVIGGLGYPTYHDIKKKIKAKNTGEKVRFSLFTKLNFWVYIPLLILGPLAVYFSEFAHKDTSLIFNNYSYEVDPLTGQAINIKSLVSKTNTAVIMDVIFNTTSCRNAGFSTVPMNDFNSSSKLLLSTFMFIGSAPSSTAGGIRTTTFAIIILSTIALIRNNQHTSAFRKTIPAENVRRSFAVFFISVFIVFMTLFGIYVDSYSSFTTKVSLQTNDDSVIKLLLLITSAYGTVGMNPFTQNQMLTFGTLSKLLLLLCMFLGQLGVSNTLLAFIKPSRKTNSKFLDEDVTIG
ncbi:potassium uptake protein KtrB [Entomoplasma ellychniae]|uniref:Potassium uptake protein KtrB n=1 Tax=Entomoplasma ellychniae TaxID=2114 RepID=A0A8E2UAA0_9MOLU|nr:potassium transporter TrkG [Entomoplasma ellychniae]PPE04964.1 potassium uptake protein KtrB [Entomoplasma ellychniae]